MYFHPYSSILYSYLYYLHHITKSAISKFCADTCDDCIFFDIANDITSLRSDPVPSSVYVFQTAAFDPAPGFV